VALLFPITGESSASFPGPARSGASPELPQKEVERFYYRAALDAGVLNQNGVETIMFGPGELRFAHTDQEVVALQEVRDAVKIYAAAALQLLA
jgi:acetylornithine deacetylase/succinyl-diaminopimelate desuccinylase-like protein